ncbi:coiled-coil domain-containing protein 90B, mitochondrial isoform X3 [Pipistrellus kuhlii]|uniref:coiled-coil domain-containing protein 90B, mitochondrial isoform X3 n=1 Tax=Pipistrellus kuhlii TaxID=59472 RepID=UPI00174F28DE|nr:coiled-coil domain-containing protein 90B, mitochondrial isoform X3 [Pipistrellus kuhlii]
MPVNCGSSCEEAPLGLAEPLCEPALGGVLATGRKLHFPASSRLQNYRARKSEREPPSLPLPPADRETRDMWGRSAWRLLRSESPGGRRVSAPRGRFSLALRRGFDKAQAETIVSALTTLSNVSLDTIYKEMVTQAQQEITVQQLMAHLDSIRKDMVILEKSEFANLRADNEKMKSELEQVKQQLINETSRIRADNKLDINLERSRVTDMFTDQEKKLMEATTEFTKKDTITNSIISETSNKIDTEIASLKTLMESNKLETIRYLAASVFTCLAIALGFYRFWK